jgi:dipeptidyl aminopeptidase/acylaminoacyl peptidase
MRSSSVSHASAALAIAALAASAASAHAQTARPASRGAVMTSAVPAGRVSLDQYLDYEDVSAPALSPDGKSVIYTRRAIDKMNDRWESSLWIVNADGSKNRFLVKGGDARWSPDGTRIAYVAPGEPTGAQIFVRWMDAEGATTQVTHVDQAPSGIQWSPDSKSIAFTMVEMLKEQPSSMRIAVPQAPRGAKWVEPPRIVTRLRWRADRQGIFPDGYRHIYVVSADAGTPRKLTDGNWDHQDPNWTSDGRSILFTSHRVSGAEYWPRESEIYGVDVASGAIRQITHHPGPDANPTPSPDGKLIAFTASDSTDDTHRDASLWVMNADGSARRELTKGLDRTPQNLQWSADGSLVYFGVQSEGNQDLYAAPLDGKWRAITSPATSGAMHVLNVAEVGRGGRAVAVRSTPTEPNAIVAFDVRDPKAAVQLTHVNEDLLAGKTLATTEEIWYPAKDGFRVQGWIVKPPDFDPSRKYPLILSIHGGPHAMDNTAFKLPYQLHAAKGYVVLYTNPRGSTGYGSRFANAIKNAWPGPDYDDLMTGVDTLLGRGYIDPKNLFVYGCSGGGTMTAWIVGHTDRFAAAVAQCPITDMLSMVGTTDVFWYWNFQKNPWDDPSEHLRRSPIMYVGHATTPTLLMTGVQDLRTPVPQAEEFYEALRLRRVPTELIRFNNEWHGTTSTPSNFLRTHLYLWAWFDEWARKDGNVAGGGAGGAK